MKQKDQIDQVLEEPIGGSRTDESQAERTTEASEETFEPRSASQGGEYPGRLCFHDVVAIEAVLEYLGAEYREFFEMPVRSNTHIGHELQWLAWRAAGEKTQRRYEEFEDESDEHANVFSDFLFAIRHLGTIIGQQVGRLFQGAK